MEENKVIVATDGGCRGNQEKNNIGAYAAVLYFREHRKVVSQPIKNTTNNQMELRAVIEGLKTIKNDNFPIEVYSDSAYVVNGINKKWYVKWRENGWTKSDGKEVKNYELWKELVELYESFSNITFHKVAGHSGHYYNEEVDRIVNEEMDKLT